MSRRHVRPSTVSTLAPAKTLRILTFLLAATMIACGGGDSGTGPGPTPPPPPPPPPPGPVAVATVSVALGSSAVMTGATTQATATLRDANGATLTGRSVQWSTSNSAVASVNQNGLVTAVTAGTATISATSEGRSGNATVTVTQPAVATVTLAAAQSQLTPGLTTTVTATVRDGNGNALSGRAVQWSSSASAVASVDQTGVVTALSVGTTTISATSEGRTGTVVITVATPTVATVQVTPGSAALPVGQTTTLSAVARDAGGTVLTGRPVSWLSSNGAIATVNGNGLVAAVSAGTATITAMVDGIQGAATVQVSSVAVASVTLSSPDLTMTVGSDRIIIAVARDANSNPLPGRTVQWSSSDLQTVDGYVFGDTAIVTGLRVGSAQVTATVEGKSKSILVTVTAPPVANVCAQIAGALIYAANNQYLGRLTNRFDSQSALNEFGTYGSPFAALSTNNQFGQYGSPYSSLSARNPYTSTPPILYINGQAIAYYTTNSFLSPRVSPAFALTCNFP